MVTIQSVCAHAALTVRTHRPESKNPISEADLEWIFARNYEGTESLHFVIIQSMQVRTLRVAVYATREL